MAAASGSSPGNISPLGIVQEPRSFFAQKGPPGWTSSTSSRLSRTRYNRRPALTLDIRFNPIIRVRITSTTPGSTYSKGLEADFVFVLLILIGHLRRIGVSWRCTQAEVNLRI